MRFKARLKSLVERSDTRSGHIFDLFVQALILMSVVAFTVGTLPTLSPETRTTLRSIEVVTVILFSAEYLLRFWVADRKLAYMLSPFGIIDLAAILPFYITTGLDLRALRSLRFLRLLRLLKLARYSAAVRRFHKAFYLVREELALYFTFSCLLMYLAGVGIYYFERTAQPETFASVFHSLWWALETLTTVGYGDIYPVTIGGKLFTFFVLMIGLGVVAVPAGLVASALSEARRLERENGGGEATPSMPR